MKLGTKLIAGNQVLIIATVVLLGGLAMFELNGFRDNVVDDSSNAILQQATANLEEGAKSDAKLVEVYVQSAARDAHRLASSPNLTGYLAALRGQNEIWNSLAKNEVVRVVDGFWDGIQTQNEMRQHEVNASLRVARDILERNGGFRLEDDSTTWSAVNQYTKDATDEELPSLAVGDTPVPKTTSFDTPQPVVDEVTKLVGGTCTIFQRMNEAGDMLRVATSVKKLDGERAVGTYIPAVDPDGQPNRVISKVLEGETYRGRAYVVNAWYVTAYEPIFGAEHEVVGILYVGVKEQNSGLLTQQINECKIGETGYPFIMDGDGVLIHHPKESLIGKDTVKDLGLDGFKEILRNRKSNEVRFLDYEFEGRLKFVAYRYVPEWDWIICGSGYYSDLTKTVAKSTFELVELDLVSLAKESRIKASGQETSFYSQIRLISSEGDVLAQVVDGELTKSPESRKDADWLQQVLATPDDGFYASDIVLAKNTGKPEMRIGVPIHSQSGELEGAVVLNVNWDFAQLVLGDRVYGETGYVYIVNKQGVLVTHPRYTLTDGVDLSDPNNGQALADLMRDQILKWNEGASEYSFEGVPKIAAFRPLQIGEHSYSVITTTPKVELMGAAKTIQASASERMSGMAWWLLGGGACIFVVGAVVSFLMSRQVTRPIIAITKALRAIAVGDLDVEVDHHGRDEIGEMADAYRLMSESQRDKVALTETIASGDLSRDVALASDRDTLGKALQTMTDNLNDLVQDINRATSQVTSGTHQIGDASQTLSDSAAQTASSLEEITSSMTQIGGQAQHNAESAQEASKLANAAKDAAETGADRMRDMVSAMSEINASSEQIAKIITTIDDIAFQTNLLALNAAVEAARAGSSGKGFAVVAEEVRNLAGRSAKAASETAELIQQSNSRVENGARITNETAESLSRIVEDISKAADLVGDIAGASNEQAQGVSQVNIGLQQVDEVTQRNTASAEKTASTSTRMNEEAAKLTELIGRFRLRGSTTEDHLLRESRELLQETTRTSDEEAWSRV